MPLAPKPPEFSSSSDDPQSVGNIGDLAADAGLRRIHILAWRDLADVEAGGSELHASRVAASWAAAGIEVTMRTSYAAGASAETVRDGYRVVRRAGRYMIFPRAVAAELAGHHGRRDGLVEIWNGVPFFSPIWARGPSVTWIHHIHEELWPMVLPPKRALAGQLLECRLAPPFYRTTPIVTLSESSRQHIIDRFRLPTPNVHVVPPGIDRRFTPGSRRAEVPTVVAAGRLMPSKGFADLIDAMVRVRREVPARLRIVGHGYERDRLEGLIGAHGAEDWCELVGHVNDSTLVELYRTAWLVVSASKSEGWGMTLTEAGACGTPAVATRIPGHLDAIDDGTTGLLADSGPDLTAAIVRLLLDDRLRERMGVAARRRAERYTWERTAYGTLGVLAASVQHR